MKLAERADGAVEHDVLRALVQHLLDAELLAPLLAEGAVRVNFSLHYVEFAIDARQAALRLDKDHAVHSVGDVLGHHRGGAVIDKQTGNQRLESEYLLLTGRRLQPDRAASRTGRPMEIDRVHHRAVRRVLHVDLDRIAHAHAHERTRHCAVEGPEGETGPVGKAGLLLD